ncbi:MAG: SPASM domain-containing protein, partial [Nanoarchaeota archaeon]|nr:SPASM domain-containing protein [Nanoarchaeota archaeon]
MFINTLGKITPCYANYNEETYPEKNLKEIWFGKQFNKLRKRICRNDLSNGCEFCKTFVDNEKVEGILAEKYDNMVFDTDEFPNRKNKVYPKIIEFE